MNETECYRAFPKSAMLIAPGYENQVNASWFDVDTWGAGATEVDTGGRGAAWFLDAPGQQLVLRGYRRGGLAARISKDRYLFTREEAVRSFAEFRMLRQLQALGLPVPGAVAAWYELAGPRQYRAAILLERLTGATTFATSEQAQDPALWTQAGELIRRFHEAGLDHADLNCDNILVTHNALYLIDFDRCSLRSAQTDKGNWRRNNIGRLRRSVDKRFRQLKRSHRDALWAHLLAGYD